mmetsp:Transcript_37425/g.98712  ORF Transcript_37425/g.98712 Transcript_37425/m.98712 type:complete len:110 (+) Transcript_37425:2196-2525(+)
MPCLPPWQGSQVFRGFILRCSRTGSPSIQLYMESEIHCDCSLWCCRGKLGCICSCQTVALDFKMKQSEGSTCWIVVLTRIPGHHHHASCRKLVDKPWPVFGAGSFVRPA